MLLEPWQSLENDATGQITASGSSGTFSGFIDTELDFSAQPDIQLDGTFSAVSSTGRATGTISNTFYPAPGSSPSTLAVAFYLIDSGHGYFIETDSLTSGELTVGYFAMRTSVCPGCQ